jgi:hypothetical protein
MSIHRTVQHAGRTMIVISVDMTTSENIVHVAPITGGRINTKTGAVVSVAYASDQRVRLVNPHMSTGLTGAQLRNAIMDSAARLVRKPLSLGPADPELVALVNKAINA